MKFIATIAATIMASALCGMASAQQANYFERETTIPVRADQPTATADINLSGPSPLYGSVRTISVWCQLASKTNPTGLLVQVKTPKFANGAASLIVPMTLQYSDDEAASPMRYYAGAITPFFEVASGLMSTVTITSKNGSEGLCEASFYGVIVQR
jgi:hypothetical protein